MPAATALDGGPEGIGVRDGDHQTGGPLGDRCVDELGHRDHVALGGRGAVVDGDAHVRAARLNAVAHDAPEAVDGLAVRDDLDGDGAALDERPVKAARAGGRCRRADVTGSADEGQDGDRDQGPS